MTQKEALKLMGITNKMLNKAVEEIRETQKKIAEEKKNNLKK